MSYTDCPKNILHVYAYPKLYKETTYNFTMATHYRGTLASTKYCSSSVPLVIGLACGKTSRFT